MKKLIDFKALVKEIQDYADEKCEGNFSFAVRQLIANQLVTQELMKRVAK